MHPHQWHNAEHVMNNVFASSVRTQSHGDDLQRLKMAHSSVENQQVLADECLGVIVESVRFLTTRERYTLLKPGLCSSSEV
jgi:hypothetical protein